MPRPNASGRGIRSPAVVAAGPFFAGPAFAGPVFARPAFAGPT